MYRLAGNLEIHRASPPLKFQTSIKLDVKDAKLIIDCHQNNHNINEKHARYYTYLNSLDLSHFLSNNYYTEVNLDVFRNFIENFLPSKLRKEVLVGSTTRDLLHLSNLLLHHDCTIKNSCKKHFHLIMKFRLLAKSVITMESIFQDLFIFRDVGLGSSLMAIYFMKFVDNLELMYFFFTYAQVSDLEYFIEKAHSILVPYLVNFFIRFSHDCVVKQNEFLFALLFKYGAINLDGQAFYTLYHLRNYGYQFYGIMGFPHRQIDSRIKMRVLQVVILYRKKLDFTMQMLTASLLEPYLTEVEYKNTFNQLFQNNDNTITQNRDLENLLKESWDWYKGIFMIEDNDPVTPRTLQEICRYWIRRLLSYNNQLPIGVDSINGIADNLKNYLSFQDFLLTYDVLRNIKIISFYIKLMRI